MTDMSNLFQGATSFNQPLANWNTSQVTDMSSMFARASAFNQPIGSWDTSKVRTMANMFFDASAFNQPIGSWDIRSVTTLDGMFDEGWTFLIFEPYWQNGTGDAAPVVPEEWQQWTEMENGNWWSSRSSEAGLEAGAGGPPFYTLADVLDIHPDATVGFIQLGIGSNTPDWSVAADGMTFAGTTYDFEPALEQEPDFRSCFDGGWEGEFRNQGQCVASFRATDANPNARFNR